MSNHADEHSFNVKLVSRLHEDRLHRRIGGMQFDVLRLFEIGLDRGLTVDQRHNGLTVLGRLLFAHDNEIAGKNALVFHRLPFHAQGEGLSPLQHAGWHIDEFRLLYRFDRKTRRNDTGHWNLRHPAQPIDRHFDHAGNPTHPGFVPRNRHTGGVERISELLLRQTESLTNAFEIGRLHDVTNGYIPDEALSSPCLDPLYR